MMRNKVSFTPPMLLGRFDPMKGRRLFLSVSLITLILIIMMNIMVFAEDEKYPVYFSFEQQIHQQMKSRGHDSSYVSIHNKELVIKFEAADIDSNLPTEMIEILRLGYTLYEQAETITIESFYEERPLYRITANASDVMEFAQNEIEADELFDRMAFSDIRTRKDLIKASFLPLNVHVHDIELDTKKLQINASYLGSDEQDLLEDYISMAYLSLQNAPWVDRVIVRFSFEQGMGEATLSATTNDILNLLEENMTEEQFFNRVKAGVNTYATPTGWKRVLLRTINDIRRLPYGNTILLVLLAMLFLILFRIIFKIIKRLRRGSRKPEKQTYIKPKNG